MLPVVSRRAAVVAAVAITAQLFALVHKHGYAQTKVIVHNGSKGSTIIETIGSFDITVANWSGVCFMATKRVAESTA
jgi:hypothetical protein